MTLPPRSRSRYVDDDDEFELLGGKENPFVDDDSKYRFEVSEIAIGSMDGKNLKFYEVKCFFPSF
jgi:hypothetical protein